MHLRRSPPMSRLAASVRGEFEQARDPAGPADASASRRASGARARTAPCAPEPRATVQVPSVHLGAVDTDRETDGLTRRGSPARARSSPSPRRRSSAWPVLLGDDLRRAARAGRSRLSRCGRLTARCDVVELVAQRGVVRPASAAPRRRRRSARSSRLEPAQRAEPSPWRWTASTAAAQSTRTPSRRGSSFHMCRVDAEGDRDRRERGRPRGSSTRCALRAASSRRRRRRRCARRSPRRSDEPANARPSTTDSQTQRSTAAMAAAAR